MTSPTPEQLQTATNIPTVLLERSKDKTKYEQARYIYNEAVTDVTSFIGELAVQNPQARSALEAVKQEILVWLIIPERDKS